VNKSELENPSLETGVVKRHITSGAVAFRRKGEITQVILIRVKNHQGWFWGLPKGHVNPDETLLGAAIRELSEETGLEECRLKALCYLGSISYEFVTSEGERLILNKKEVHFFLVEVAGEGEPKFSPDENILECKWVELNNAITQTSFPTYKEILIKARNSLFNR